MGQELGTVEGTFGTRLREERQRRGWSQAEVAKRLSEVGTKLHWSAVAKMEARDAATPRAIRLNEAAAVAKVFGMDLIELLEDGPDTGRALALVNRALEDQLAAQESWSRAYYALVSVTDRIEDPVAQASPDVLLLGDRWVELKRCAGPPSRDRREEQSLERRFRRWRERLAEAQSSAGSDG